MSATVFIQRNFVADFLQASAILDGNRPFCVLEPPLGDLGATYDDHLRLIGKRVGDFLLVLIELFSLGRTAEELRTIIGSKQVISLQRGPVDPKFQAEGVASHQPFLFSEK